MGFVVHSQSAGRADLPPFAGGLGFSERSPSPGCRSRSLPRQPPTRESAPGTDFSSLALKARLASSGRRLLCLHQRGGCRAAPAFVPAAGPSGRPAASPCTSVLWRRRLSRNLLTHLCQLQASPLQLPHLSPPSRSQRESGPGSGLGSGLRGCDLPSRPLQPSTRAGGRVAFLAPVCSRRSTFLFLPELFLPPSQRGSLMPET